MPLMTQSQVEGIILAQICLFATKAMAQPKAILIIS